MTEAFKPTHEEAARVASSGGYNLIPLSTEIYADIATPIEVMRTLKAVSRHCFMLESAEDTKNWGRYTFLGFDPKMGVTALNGEMRIEPLNGANAAAQTFQTDDPNRHIQDILDRHKSVKFDWLPPFSGGFVGYFAYDYAKYAEPSLKLDARDAERFNDVDLMLFDKVIAFDHYRQKIVLIVNISAENVEASYAAGVRELGRLKSLILEKAQKPIAPARVTSEFTAQFSQEEFCKMVVKAKEYIREGDIFQVVLSNCLEADCEGSIFDAYRALRTINPSPYMLYFSGSDVEIAGASPETLVKLRDGKLFTFPLAGTSPRGANDEEEEAFEKRMLADEKELAEHNMLVDLGRNDLGKISKFGTVAVENYKSVLRFSHVMHIGSTVTGEICDGLTGLDAISAVLPAGTLSGAPKIRAMQIIHELEGNKRGVYGGAIGYLDFTGNMDTCIAIRIIYKKAGKVFVRSGAGIVADSEPEKEYQECLNKAQAARNALKHAEGGLC